MKPDRPRTAFADLPPAQQAALLCTDPRFRRYAARRCDLPVDEVSTSAAAEFLRSRCGVPSRRDLNTNPAARAAFDALRTEFDAWTGKIAAPR